jgi:hypothetical protein
MVSATRGTSCRKAAAKPTTMLRATGTAPLRAASAAMLHAPGAAALHTPATAASAASSATASSAALGEGVRFQKDERKDDQRRCQILELHDSLLRTSWFLVIVGREIAPGAPRGVTSRS